MQRDADAGEGQLSQRAFNLSSDGETAPARRSQCYTTMPMGTTPFGTSFWRRSRGASSRPSQRAEMQIR